MTETFWNAGGIFAVSPEYLKNSLATIESIDHSDENALKLVVKKVDDSTRQFFVLTHDYRDVPKEAVWEDPEPPMEYVDRSKKPKSIQLFLDDCKVTDSNELIGMELTGVYLFLVY